MVEKIRKLVIFTLKRAISSKQFDWKNADPENLQSSEQWMEKMSKNGEFCDHISVQMASDALCRDIMIIPVVKADRGPDTLKVSPFSKSSRREPFYILYFSEARFSCGGHYQSIVKKIIMFQLILCQLMQEKIFCLSITAQKSMK